MQQFTCLKNLKTYSQDLYQTIKNLGLSSNKYSLFIEELGGDVYIIDSYAELAALMAGSQVDIISKSLKGLYMMIVVLNNNSGGPTYCMHVELYESWLESMPDHIKAKMQEATNHD